VIGRLTTPRALALLVVALVVMAVMIAMGRWQYGVYDDHQRADAMAVMRRAAVPLDSALGPDQAFPSASVGIPVVVSGRYDRSDQLYVRHLAGSKGAYAVVTPLLTGSGSAVLVVRGSASATQAPAARGPVRVVGILEPSPSQPSSIDSRRVTDSIWLPGLVSAVRPDLYSGYVVLTRSDPAEPLARVEPPLPAPSRWAGLRNLLYAVQWWIFAAFVGFMWWRISTDDPAEVAAAPDATTDQSGRVAS
jgi:cytochrome oxidase assembly protein ShyY1